MLSVVVPVYNEEKNIQIFLDKITVILERLENYEIIFCLDPSMDNTEVIIKKNIISNKNIKLIKFSRRFKQSNAILAGIENCSGDHCVIIDVDLQDPPELIEKMYHTIKEGHDCVFAKRTRKVGENIVRLLIIKIYYFIINKFSEVPIPKNVGEFRIISRRMINYIKIHGTYNFYLRGITSLIGFSTTSVDFVRKSRNIGESKYIIGSYKDALNGILNFTSLAQNFAISIFFINLFVSMLLFFLKKISFVNFYIFLLFSFIFFFIYFIISYLIQINNIVHKKPNYIIEEKINF
jgi:glycosyltransferase involved in cell wall biosynthesis